MDVEEVPKQVYASQLESFCSHLTPNHQLRKFFHLDWSYIPFSFEAALLEFRVLFLYFKNILKKK
jgi:hypothetical protein